MKVLNVNTSSKDEVITIALSFSDLSILSKIQGINGIDSYRSTEDHILFFKKIVSEFIDFLNNSHLRNLSYKKSLEAIDEFKSKLEFLHKKGA